MSFAACACKSLFGDPPASLTRSALAAPSSIEATSEGLALGLPARISAAAPATCGAAIEVPLSVAEALSPLMPADWMPSPGANRSTHLPLLENDARLSPLVLAATVNAGPRRDGEPSQASRLSLPAATS